MILREITLSDKDEIVKMCEEIRNNDYDNTFEGLTNFKNVYDNNYDDFLNNLEKNKNIEEIKDYLVNQTTYILVDENNHIYGGVNIRHRLNDNLLKHGGHIGYLIRPTERRKGFANMLVNLSIKKCKDLNIDKILITCREDNIGSKKAIENNGFVYENSVIDENTNIKYRRYWLN